MIYENPRQYISRCLDMNNMEVRINECEVYEEG
jgi:hypothetical protein